MHTLRPQLELLIEKGTLTRAEAEHDLAFIREVFVSAECGLLTPEQSKALCSMLGFARFGDN